jgi:CheY-like chemotaxis protein
VVVTVSELLKQTLPKTISVTTDLDPSLPAVMADPNQLNQALLNISVNARDAMPGGGSLTFATTLTPGTELRKRHADSQTGAYVSIAITDTGTGMDESVQARIFEPFFTTKGFGEGTGLGLAMVYGLIKNHNGFIDVESAVSRGTTFRLHLPAAQASAERVELQANARPPVRSFDLQRGTVLVVEDEKSMLRLLTDVLEQCGYRVLAATDGEEAIELFRGHKEKIDVVLLDLNLPKANGSDVIRALKHERPAIHIVVASGYLEPELKEQLLETGVKDYINKPYLIDEVLQKLQSLPRG